ncbi:MAG: hypothetical protein IPK82_17165 [Polyangiaceae bacterium]|nr:hypothetical protein [Polyangiaceae bacterium]
MRSKQKRRGSQPAKRPNSIRRSRLPLAILGLTIAGHGIIQWEQTAHADGSAGHIPFEIPHTVDHRPEPRPLPDFPPVPILPSAAVGYLPGQAGVSSDGAATYTIPLDVPAGVAGMEPHLAINYSSKGDNGLLGLGFSLSGSSQIERCHKNLRLDGQVDGVAFSPDDALCYNGKRLVKVGTTADGPEYRAPSSPFDRIVHILADNSFEVRSDDGKIALYQPLYSPRQKTSVIEGVEALRPFAVELESDGEEALLWPLHEVFDRFGNSVQYHYTTEVTSLPTLGAGISSLLTSITYTHHASAAAARKVDLFYELRPEVDRSFKFVNGVRVDRKHRLTRLEMWAPSVPGGSPLFQWSYQLRYLETPSAKTERSQLTGVKRCDSFGQCSWEKQFEWQGQGAPLTITPTYSPLTAEDPSPWQDCETRSLTTNETRPIVFDADGDGRQDVLLLKTEDMPICSEEIFPDENHWAIYLSSHNYAPVALSQDFYFLTAHGQIAPGRYRSIDVNNDHRQDLIFALDEGVERRARTGSGNLEYRCITWHNANNEFVPCASTELKDLSNSDWGTPRWAPADQLRWPLWNFGDFNGDGRVDLAENDYIRPHLGLLPNGYAVFAPTQEPIDLLDYDDAPNHVVEWPWHLYNRSAEVMDVNGDGRAELILASPTGIDPHFATGPNFDLPGGEPQVTALGLDTNGALTTFSVPGLSKGQIPWMQEVMGQFVPNDDTFFFSVAADINGDGLKDQVIIRHITEFQSNGATLRVEGQDAIGGIGTYVQFNTGRGYTPAVRTQMQFRPIEQWAKLGPLTQWQDGSQSYYYTWAESAYPAAVDVVDVNGDGRDDIVVKSMETWQWDPNSNELAFLVPPSVIGLPADLTTDSANAGSSFWYTRVYLSTGTDFKLVENPFDPGLPTAVSGNGYIYSRPAQLDDDPEPEYLIRGRSRDENGTPWDPGAVKAYHTGKTLTRVDLNSGPPEVVAVVKDEDAAGPREKFFYKDAHFPQESGCSYPFDCPSQMPTLVDQHHTSLGRDVNGTAIFRRTKHEYFRPRVDVRGGGFLGFDKALVTDLDTAAKTATYYDSNTVQEGEFFPFAGLATRVESFAPIYQASQDANPVYPLGSTRVRISTVENTPQTVWRDGGLTFFTYTAQQTIHVFERTMTIQWDDGIPRLEYISGSTLQDEVSYVTEYRTVDDCGNTTSSSTEVLGGQTRTVLTSYICDDGAPWLLHLPSARSEISLGQTRSTQWGYDSKGFLQSILIQPNDIDPAVRRTTHLVRDERGRLLQTKEWAPGVAPRIANLYYDAEGIQPVEVINAVGHVTTSLSHPALGVVVLTQDENGVISKAKYDGMGRLRSAQGPTNLTLDNVAYTAVTDGNGKVIGLRSDETYSDGAENTLITDPLGRAVETAVRGFDGTMLHAATAYNLLGQPVVQTRMGKTAPSVYASQVVYDTLGRVVTTIDPDGVETHVDYQPFQTRVTDALGHERTSFYDVDHRLSRSEEVLVNQGQTQTLTTTFAYGPFDQLNETVDPAGNILSVRHDILGRKVYLEDADAGIFTFEYNGLGELTQRSTALGTTVTYQYDPLSRPTSKIDADGTWTYHWDTAPNGIARPAAARSPDQIDVVYAYDAIGRPSTVTTTLDATESFAFDYHYDAFGRIAALDYPQDPSGSRFQAQFEYNNFGFPLSTSRTVLPSPQGTPTALVWKTLKRGDDLALEEALFGNGVKASWDRDPVTAMLSQITAEPDIGFQPALLFKVSYGYNSLRNITSRHWEGEAFAGGNVDETFQYDALDRLHQYQVTGPVQPGAATWNYGYDISGNLTSILKGSQPTYQASYGLAGRPNALAASTATNNFEYDGAGRQTKAGNRTVDYTDASMPRTVWVDGAATHFRYGPEGQRVEKESAQSRTVTILGLYEKRTTTDGEMHVFHVPAAGGSVAQVTRTFTSTNTTEDIRYMLGDHAGSVAASFDSAANVEAQVYEPWGERIYHGGNGTALLSTITTGYTSQQGEPDLGWIHMNARTYDPVQKRFLVPDPIVGDPVFSQGRNRYAYVRNNPMRYSDPSGLAGVEAPIESPPARTDSSGVIHMPTAKILGYRQPNLREEPSPTSENLSVEVTPTWLPAKTGPKSSTLVNLGEMVADPVDRLSMTLGAQEGAGKWAVDTGLGTAQFVLLDAATGGLSTAAMPLLQMSQEPERFTGDPQTDYLLQILPGGATLKHLVRAKHAVDNNEPYRVGKEMAAPTLDAGVLILSMAAGPAMEAGAVAPAGTGGSTRTFFRGMTYGEALEVCENQALNAERIGANQALNPGAADPGAYITSQSATAAHYAEISGIQGRGLGPSVVRIDVNAIRFDAFAAKYGIKVETPIPRGPFPGATETVIPIPLLGEFNKMSTFTIFW